MLLNEWEAFEQVGMYTIQITLPGVGSGTLTVIVGPRDPAHLNEVCNELATRAIETDNSAQILSATHTLSFVIDPVAVPYLAKVALRKDEPDAYRGLERIGDSNAVSALAALITNGKGEVPMWARGGLQHIRAFTKDESLKAEIDRLLAQSH